MKRLTTNKDISDIEGMYELAHNSCYIDKNGNARYRDFETDIDARVLTRDLLKKYADGDDAFIDDDDFDNQMMEALQYGTDTIEGVIALLYRNLWAMADLRERLEHYEETELTPEEVEDGLLYIRLAKRHGTIGLVIDECIQYEEIGTVEEFRRLKRRYTPKAAVITGHNNAINTDIGECPNCTGLPLRACDFKYCPECGQRLDWSK